MDAYIYGMNVHEEIHIKKNIYIKRYIYKKTNDQGRYIYKKA